ncbi:MAG: C40 family peptidase [Muribaculaceae bacterium]|nr:C40 family peptidase [Muribaculaceae bacterium]
MEEALTWKGTPYGYGRAEKGKASDCSGMVMSVYEKVTGIKLPRNSAQQQDFCKHLKKKEVKIGDLCFFATGKDPDKTSHVGIMIDEKNFIHASTSKGVVVSDISQPYYVRTFKGYGRVPDLSND